MPPLPQAPARVSVPSCGRIVCDVSAIEVERSVKYWPSATRVRLSASFHAPGRSGGVGPGLAGAAVMRCQESRLPLLVQGERQVRRVKYRLTHEYDAGITGG